MAGLHFTSGIDKGFETDLKRMNDKMNKFDSDVEKSSKKIDSNFKGIGNTIKGFAIAAGINEIGAAVLKLTEDTYEYRQEISKLTQLEGTELNEFTANVTASAQTFDKEISELGLATSNFAKGMELDFDAALSIVNKGFIEGADASDEFLATLTEYSPLMKEAGLNGQQFVDIITQSTNEGIYSDKGIDTIKEANIRLREMPQATADALDAIGISSKELSQQLSDGVISTFEATQLVANKLAELPPQSKVVGTAIADIFEGS